jgi:hypothetical protein
MIKLLPFSPNNLRLVFAHQLPGRIVALDMRPRSCKVNHKSAGLPHLLLLIIATDLFGEGIEFELRDLVRIVGVRILFFENSDHAVLLAELVALCIFFVVAFAGAVEEADGPGVAANEEGAGIEAVACLFVSIQGPLPATLCSSPVVRQQVVNCIRVFHAGQALRDDVRDFDVCICDKSVEVHPPYPFVFARFDQSLNHVKLGPEDPALRMRFVVDDKIEAMASCIV